MTRLKFYNTHLAINISLSPNVARLASCHTSQHGAGSCNGATHGVCTVLVQTILPRSWVCCIDHMTSNEFIELYVKDNLETSIPLCAHDYCGGEFVTAKTCGVKLRYRTQTNTTVVIQGPAKIIIEIITIGLLFIVYGVRHANKALKAVYPGTEHTQPIYG